MCQKRTLLQTKWRRRQMIDRHRRKRISKSKSSRRRDVYVSPYQPNSSSDEEYISDTSVRRKKMPKPKKHVRERKKDQELEKTESEDTDSDSITEDNKTGKQRSRSQQRRRDKGKSTKPKIVSSKLTYRKRYSKLKTNSYLTSWASSGSSSSEI